MKPIDPSSLAFLKELATATIESARVKPGQSRGGTGPNGTGITLITPGGNYPALWTRDCAMSLDCGLISAAEILPQLRLIARCQNGEKERRLPSGGIIPPFAIVDHVNLAGGAVFYPGTYSAGEDQGAPPWGPLPPIDDHFYFIHIAYTLWRDTGDAKFLHESIGDRSLLDRLERAFSLTRFRSENRRGGNDQGTSRRWFWLPGFRLFAGSNVVHHPVAISRGPATGQLVQGRREGPVCR